MENNEIIRSMAEFNNLWKEQNEIYAAAAKSFGLSESSMWILYFLRISGGSLTQKEINSAMLQPKQTTNSAIKQLERSGFVDMCDGADRRCRLVSLTEAGELLAERSADRVLSAEGQTWGDFSGEERKQLIGLLKKYNERLKERLGENNEEK